MRSVRYSRVRGLVRVALVVLSLTLGLGACVETMGPIPVAYYSQQSSRTCRPPARLGEREATTPDENCTDWVGGPPARKASR